MARACRSHRLQQQGAGEEERGSSAAPRLCLREEAEGSPGDVATTTWGQREGNPRLVTALKGRHVEFRCGLTISAFTK